MTAANTSSEAVINLVEVDTPVIIAEAPVHPFVAANREVTSAVQKDHPPATMTIRTVIIFRTRICH